jgi:hypothetical protein
VNAKITSNDLKELYQLQPNLVVNNNQILGCFNLCASITKPNNPSKTKVVCYTNNLVIKNDKNLIQDSFYINIALDEMLYPTKVCETDNKILSWKNEIPEEYWHINPDNSLCLGERGDIEELQKNYSFAQFIHIILSEYFYHMSYVKKYKKEPWKGYRHGLFLALEFCYTAKNIENISEYHKSQILKLWKKIEKLKLKPNDKCPFHEKSQYKPVVKNCKRHYKHIKGYNNFISSIKNSSQK